MGGHFQRKRMRLIVSSELRCLKHAFDIGPHAATRHLQGDSLPHQHGPPRVDYLTVVCREAAETNPAILIRTAETNPAQETVARKITTDIAAKLTF